MGDVTRVQRVNGFRSHVFLLTVEGGQGQYCELLRPLGLVRYRLAIVVTSILRLRKYMFRIRSLNTIMLENFSAIGSQNSSTLGRGKDTDFNAEHPLRRISILASMSTMIGWLDLRFGAYQA